MSAGQPSQVPNNSPVAWPVAFRWTNGIHFCDTWFIDIDGDTYELGYWMAIPASGERPSDEEYFAGMFGVDLIQQIPG
jgi:hypothetical protein